MAQVHPSRAGFIPREEPPARERDRNSKRDHDRDYRSSRRGHSRSRSPRRERSRSPERRSSPARRSRSRERMHGRPSSPPHLDSHANRNSPSYDAYRAREASGEQGQNNWARVPPPRASAANAYSGGYSAQGGGWQKSAGGHDYVEERRKRREAMTVNVWPPSPKAPVRDLSPHGHSRSKNDKHRSKDKDKKRSKHRSRSEDRHRKRHEDDRKRKRRRSRSTSPSESETDSSEDRRRRKRRERERDDERDRDYDRKSRSKSYDARDSRPLEMEEDEDAWVEKPATQMPPPPVPIQTPVSNQVAAIATGGMDDEDSDMDEVGPQLPVRAKEKIDERSYGGALLRGEGSAMAAFLQADPHTRIPRRGEIGLTSDEIESYETVGYVMSGSRHRRMNAVRMRKENQVISAEEKRGILKLQKEERQRREELLKAEFRELVDEKLGGIGAARK